MKIVHVLPHEIMEQKNLQNILLNLLQLQLHKGGHTMIDRFKVYTARKNC